MNTRNLKVVKALLNGYEVELELKVWDWVTFDDKHIGRIIDIDEFDRMFKTDIRNENGVKQMFPSDTKRLRHATESEIKQEKERRKWAEIDREVNEYEMSDVVSYEGSKGLYEITRVYSLNNVSISNDSADSEFDVNINEIRLVVPFEKRLDVSMNA